MAMCKITNDELFICIFLKQNDWESDKKYTHQRRRETAASYLVEKKRKNKSYKSNSNVLMTIQINALFEVGFALQM